MNDTITITVAVEGLEDGERLTVSASAPRGEATMLMLAAVAQSVRVTVAEKLGIKVPRPGYRGEMP